MRPASPTIERPGSTMRTASPKPRSSIMRRTGAAGSAAWEAGPRDGTGCRGAAHVEVMERETLVAECGHRVKQSVHGVEVGLDFGDLAADVRIDALDFNAGHVGGAQVDVLHVRDGDAELVVLEARGNVGVRLRINVGIAADRDGCAHAELGSNAVDRSSSGSLSTFEAADAALSAKVISRAVLPTPE